MIKKTGIGAFSHGRLISSFRLELFHLFVLPHGVLVRRERTKRRKN